MKSIPVWSALALLVTLPAAASDISSVRVSDGVEIAVECSGSGPTLLVVHGGTGDRTRWLPMFPLLEPHVRVCAMDRRGHGESGDAEAYSIGREGRDVEEVVAALPGPVIVLGHSIGGVAALEAALRSPAIAKLILYEPPLQDGDHTEIAAEIEQLLAADRPEAAAETFFTRIVQMPPEAVAQLRAGPNWAKLVASMPTLLRMDRALGAHRWDPRRFSALRTPALLLLGGESRSPQMRTSVTDLHRTLPNARLVVLEGQGHYAMDTGREALAAQILSFLE